MADLITLTEYKTFVGITDTNVGRDARITALISPASRAIRSNTDRKFDVASSASARTFLFDGSGIMEIDDCTAVTAVTTDGGFTGGAQVSLTSDQYTAMPYRETTDDDPHYYIIFHSLPGSYSPEMGFRNNLDTIDVVQRPVLVTVTATWGWPAIPSDVKLAATWTVEAALGGAADDELTAEAIAGYSRSWGSGQNSGGSGSLAIPKRARDLLSAYERPY